MPRPLPSPSSRRGFSLIELLAVIVIISVLAGLGTYSVRSMMLSVDLTSSAAAITDTLNQARQIALSRNRPVEVRFYKVPGKDQPASTPNADRVYRALGLFVVGDSGPEQIGKLVFLPGQSRMADDQNYGPLLNYASSAQSPLRSLDSSGGTQFDYRYFQFRPDGSTTLAKQTPNSDTWHSMLYNDRQSPAGAGAPKNFITIQIDPSTGRAETFQP